MQGKGNYKEMVHTTQRDMLYACYTRSRSNNTGFSCVYFSTRFNQNQNSITVRPRIMIIVTRISCQQAMIKPMQLKANSDYLEGIKKS